PLPRAPCCLAPRKASSCGPAGAALQPGRSCTIACGRDLEFPTRNTIAGRHCSRPRATRLERNESDVVFSIRQPKGFFHLRNWRGLLAVLVASVYLLTGTLHGVYDVDVTASSNSSEIVTMLGGASGHADHKALAGHHCHGCFSVAVAQAVLPTAVAELVA